MSVHGFQSRADFEFLKVCTTFAQTVHKQDPKYSVDGERSERSGCKVYQIYSFYFILNTEIEMSMFTFFCVCVCTCVCFLSFWNIEEGGKKPPTKNKP